MKKEIIKRPNRNGADRLTVPERYELMKDLKSKALSGDMQAVIAIAMYEIVESNRKLQDTLSRSGIAA